MFSFLLTCFENFYYDLFVNFSNSLKIHQTYEKFKNQILMKS